MLITTPDVASEMLTSKVYPVADLVLPEGAVGGGSGRLRFADRPDHIHGQADDVGHRRRARFDYAL